jgi:sulfur-oxidizing protein SoxA
MILIRITAVLFVFGGGAAANAEQTHGAAGETEAPRHAPPVHAPHAAHPAGHHGNHVQAAMRFRHFPTLAYDDHRPARPVQRPKVTAMRGDPVRGKALAYQSDKGGCLACHVLGADAEQPGSVGPNLSAYGKRGRGDDYIFQQVWDARAHNPDSTMPPFGTNDILSAEEIVHIIAYLQTLTLPVPDPAPVAPSEKEYVVLGVDLTAADAYLERGRHLFRAPGRNGRACASCHGAHAPRTVSLRGAALTYPKHDAGVGRAIGLEERINLCRTARMHDAPYAPGTDESNTLSGYVKSLSRGMPVGVTTSGPAAAALARGEQSFVRKTGRLNLACADCHVRHADRWLRGQRLKPFRADSRDKAFAAKYPTYHLGRHDLGFVSLQQRIEHCQVITQSAPLKPGSLEYTELELYLTSLANGAPLVAPTADWQLGD